MKQASSSVPPTAHSRSSKNESEKLRAIRALFVVVYNDSKSLIPQSIELFHTLGSILEGQPVECLELHHIDKAALLHEMKHAVD